MGGDTLKNYQESRDKAVSSFKHNNLLIFYNDLNNKFKIII